MISEGPKKESNKNAHLSEVLQSNSPLSKKEESSSITCTDRRMFKSLNRKSDQPYHLEGRHERKIRI